MSGKLAIQLVVLAIQVILLIIQIAVIRATNPKYKYEEADAKHQRGFKVAKVRIHANESAYKTKQTGDMNASQVLDYMVANQTCLQAQSAAKHIYGNAPAAPSTEHGIRYVGRSYAYKQRPIPIHHTKYSLKTQVRGFYGTRERLLLPRQAQQ